MALGKGSSSFYPKHQPKCKRRTRGFLFFFRSRTLRLLLLVCDLVVMFLFDLKVSLIKAIFSKVNSVTTVSASMSRGFFLHPNAAASVTRRAFPEAVE